MGWGEEAGKEETLSSVVFVSNRRGARSWGRDEGHQKTAVCKVFYRPVSELLRGNGEREKERKRGGPNEKLPEYKVVFRKFVASALIYL